MCVLNVIHYMEPSYNNLSLTFIWSYPKVQAHIRGKAQIHTDKHINKKGKYNSYYTGLQDAIGQRLPTTFPRGCILCLSHAWVPDIWPKVALAN